jgi:phage major head subunit gpT-like protein
MPWEQTATEILHRVRDPNDFQTDSFRTITLKADKPRVFAVIGKLKGETNTTIQALRFPKEDGWTLAKAQQWVDQNFDKSAHQASSSTTEMTHLDGGPQRVTLGIERLAAHFEGAVNREDRTARLVFYSGAPVRRQGPGGAYDLRFSMDPANVRLGRLNDGAPLLNSHRDFTVDDVLGVVEKAWLEGGRGVAQVRFSKRTDVDPIWQDVQDGILKNASMGVAIHKLVDITKDGDQVKQMLATDWEPEEVSLVPIGADPGAGFKGRKREVQMQKNETMIGGGSSVDPAAEIRRIVLAARLPKDFAEGLVAAGATIEQARSAVLDKLAAESERVPIRSNSAVVTRDYRENLAERMGEAVACRYSGKAPSEGAREWMGVPLHELARECLIAGGVSVTTRRPAELIKMAMHTTSDFPNLLSGAGQRMMLDAYHAAEPQIKRVARRSTARDFRDKAVLRLGEMPQLLKVNEGGEITYGSRAETKQSYRLATYARIFSITRQALVNDDLGAFADFARAYGQAAAQVEGKLLADLLIINPVMNDGVALFHANHGNLSTGSGSALGLTALSSARKAMRVQKGLDGATVLDIAAAFLVVPASLETTGQQLLASTIYPTSITEANPFTGQLTLVTDPRLDAASATAWYLFASPDLAPVLEYSYLEGQEGPMVDFRQGFEVDGVEWRCRLDFGCGVLDHRGAHRADGV